MQSEKDKMLAGELYDPSDPELSAERNHAHELCRAFNAVAETNSPPRGRPKEGSLPLGGTARSAKGAHQSPPHGRPKEGLLPLRPKARSAEGAHNVAMRGAFLSALLKAPTDAIVCAPFFCDYGYNIRLGANTYFNFNCIVLDVMPVTVGANALFGPGVHIYTAVHPMSVSDRRSGRESGRPVTIENDVWVGGGAIICPGVHIGSECVIGAGSVVTRSIPAGVFAAGNPCRVIRAIDGTPASK